MASSSVASTLTSSYTSPSLCRNSLTHIHCVSSSSSPSTISFGPSFRALPRKSQALHHHRTKGGLSIKAQTLDFSGSFFEGGFGGEDDPTSPPGSVVTAVEEKEEPQCPPGLRQYETMAVLRPDMSEDERLALTQKYEESEMGLKGNLKDNLPIILVDEDLTSRDSTCCVCLGEFEIKEEVHQIPTCKHVFHIDCIGYWLHSNPTCPLCRCIIITTTITTTKRGHSQPPVGPNLVSQDNQNFNNNPQMVHDLEQQEQLVMANNNLGEHHMLVMERII